MSPPKKTVLAGASSGSALSATSSSISPELLLEATGGELMFMRLRRDLAKALFEEEPGESTDSEPEEPPASPEALKHFFSDVAATLSIMLKVYPRLLPPTAFTSRIVVYELKEDRWSFDGAFCGEPRFFQGGLDGLNGLMDGIRERTAPRSATLWMHSVSTEATALVLAYLRWSEGPPLLFSVFEGQWGTMAVPRGKRDALLKLVIGPPAGESRLWRGFMKSQAQWLQECPREPVEAYLRTLGLGVKLSQEQWNAFVAVVYDNPEILRVYQEAARDLNTGVMMEAHALLQSISTHFEGQVRYFIEKKDELEKELERKTRRLKADLERTNMLARGLQLRADRLAAENQELSRQLLSAAKADTAAEASSGPLIAALDKLFG